MEKYFAIWNELKKIIDDERKRNLVTLIPPSQEYTQFCKWVSSIMLNLELDMDIKKLDAEEEYPKTLEEYLKENLDIHHIDHAIRASINSEGTISFYIHADGYNSETLDFEVWGNDLIPKLQATGIK